MQWQGKVDAKAEIDKLEKKTDVAQMNKEKLTKVMSQANYETSVKEEVRAMNVEKVSVPTSDMDFADACQMEKIDAEVEGLRQAIERFSTLL